MDKIELMNNRWIRSAAFLFQWRESAQSSWIQLGCCTETQDPSYSFSIWTPAPRSGAMAQDRPRLWVSWGFSVQHPAGSTALSGDVGAQELMVHLCPWGLFPPIACFYLLGLYQQSWPMKCFLPDWKVKHFHKHFHGLSLPLPGDVQDCEVGQK